MRTVTATCAIVNVRTYTVNCYGWASAAILWLRLQGGPCQPAVLALQEGLPRQLDSRARRRLPGGTGWLGGADRNPVATKMARWWYRLGGRPVNHTASPRIVGSAISLPAPSFLADFDRIIPYSQRRKSYPQRTHCASHPNGCYYTGWFIVMQAEKTTGSLLLTKYIANSP
jgi:hypothetical protein